MTTGAAKSPVLAWVVSFASIGAAGILTATPEPPRPLIEGKTFQLASPEGKAVTPQQPLELPLRFRDFDLNCVVELPADGELDLVFRKVEHWAPPKATLRSFHARFSILRVSSRAEGAGFLSRDAALFGDSSGGVLVSAGAPGASLRLECRGRTARANVNGIELGPFETDDEFGNFGFAVRGGTALVRDLSITPWSAAPAWSPWRLALLAGASLGVLAGLAAWMNLLGTAWWQMVVAVLVGAGAGWGASATVLGALLPAAQPEPTSILLTTLCGAPAAVLLALRRPGPLLRVPLALVVGGGVALWCADLAVQREARRLAPFQDDRLDLVFGPESGTAPFDAMTRMLRCTFVAHTVPEGRYDVLLLGDKLLFDLNDPGQPEKNVSVGLGGRVARRLGLPYDKKVLVAASPTVLAHVYQQYLLFTSFYEDYRPKVVVLGITGEEAEAMLPLPARQLAAAAAQGSQRRGLLGLWERSRRGKVTTQSPEDLKATLGQLTEACKRLDSRLVLVLDASATEPYRAVARGFAAESGVPVVEGFDMAGGVYPVEALTEAVVGQLIR